jgi:predicted DNA-binding protein
MLSKHMSVVSDGRRDAQIGFRVRSELKSELERLAKADGRSLANYLERLFEAHVEAKRQDGKKPKTRS